MFDRLTERLRDRERWAQAFEEAWRTLVAIYIPIFVALTSGWTKFPNLEEAVAAVYAAAGGAALAAFKSVYWVLTGTKAVRPKRGRLGEGGITLVEILVVILVIVVILAIARGNLL